MATYTVGVVNGGSVSMDEFSLAEIRDFGTVTSASSTEIVVGFDDGFVDTFNGTGFTFSVEGEPEGGTIESFVETFQGGLLAFQITGLNLPVATFNPYFDAGDTPGLLALIFGGADVMTGGAGGAGDLIRGYDGADQVGGGNGADSLFGGDGMDTVTGDGGDDVLDGGLGADSLEGLAGRDMMRGGDDADFLHGYGSHDTLLGGDGNDDLRGGFGRDLLNGSADNDVLRGFEGEDRLFGGGGVDTLLGNDDNDSLIGGGGGDRLKGDAGDDSLNGSFGADLVTGGLGNDEFQFRKTHGADTIDDFVAGVGTDDVIRLLVFGAAFDTFGEVLAAASDNGTDTTIDFGGGDMLILEGVLVGQLDASDFAFG